MPTPAFPPLRRRKQELSPEEAARVLEQAPYGVLATLGTDGYPYAVPLSFAYLDGRIVFHCAPTGHKLDALRANPRVSFTAVSHNEVVPHEYTNYYVSAIAFGTARIVEDDAEKRRLCRDFALRYCEGLEAGVDEEVDKLIGRTAIVVIEIEHLSGKRAIELVPPKEEKDA